MAVSSWIYAPVVMTYVAQTRALCKCAAGGFPADASLRARNQGAGAWRQHERAL
jgi:hypothetical protein